MSPDTDRTSFDLRLDQRIYSLSEECCAKFRADFQLISKVIAGESLLSLF